MELLFHIRLINVNWGGLSESLMCSWEIRKQKCTVIVKHITLFPLQFLYCSSLIQGSMGWNEILLVKERSLQRLRDYNPFGVTGNHQEFYFFIYVQIQKSAMEVSLSVDLASVSFISLQYKYREYTFVIFLHNV